ncbi:glycosyltransferase [archaeon]
MDVSVIIPTLNEEKYLAPCLESLSSQRFSGSYEIIVGDGCSTDKTEKICGEYGAKFVVEPKPTIAAGRQKACDKAKGRIIVSTDADIHAPAEWLDSIATQFNGNVGLYGNIVPYDGSAAEAWVCKNVMSKYMHLMDVLGKPVPAGSNLSFTRKAFKEVGGFNTELVTAEDLDLTHKLMGVGKVAYNPKGVVYVSLRRVKGWGYGNYIKFHVTNAIKYHTTGKSHDSYEPIR